MVFLGGGVVHVSPGGRSKAVDDAVNIQLIVVALPA